MDKSKPIKVMISSTVYGAETLLRNTYSILKSKNYEVYSSPNGTVPANPNYSAFENCIKAVEECDVFLGIIRPIYGSGKDRKEKSITHQELEYAIKINKPRFLLVHSKVTFARRLLHQFRHDKAGNKIDLKFNPIKAEFDDLRVIDMYELAKRDDLEAPLSEKKNNWVQEYYYDKDAWDYVISQFGDEKRMRGYLNQFKRN